MTVLNLLHKVTEQDAEIKVSDGKLKILAAKGSLSGELVQQLKSVKQTLLDLFETLQISSSKTLEQLSYGQQRLWLLQRLEAAAGQYNIPVKIDITGRLNIQVLSDCLADCIARHSILRTVYVEVEDGLPVQVVRDNQDFDLALEDLRGLVPAEQAQTMDALGQAMVQQEFDLANDLMLKACLVQLAEDKFTLLLVTHHIASDGWSSAVICQDMSQSYKNYVETGANQLPPPALQYADYAHWQNQMFADGEMDRQLDYWANQLEGMPWLHNLPLDRPRSNEGQMRAASLQNSIGKSLFDDLEGLAQHHGATNFMAMHTAFAAYMQRLCGDDDIVIGTPVINREKSELQSLVGFFTNTLVLRSDLSEAPSFNQAVEKNKHTILAALEHQEIPFEKIVEKLNPPRTMNCNPLVQVVLAYQTQFESKHLNLNNYAFDGLTMRQAGLQNEVAKFDLLLTVVESEDGARLCWEYNADLFDAATIERMAANFVVFVHNIVLHPEQSLLSLPVISETEQAIRKNQWNRLSHEHPVDVCLQDLFVESVGNTPNAIALIDEQGEMTYAKLFCEAYMLAGFFAAKALEPGTLVAVRLPRGRQQVIGTLGIMMAGAAYLPMELDWPEERCLDILDTAGCQYVIGEQDTAIAASHFMTFSDILKTHQVSEQDAVALAKAYRTPQKADELAYVIFTSGSTGKPKGVAIEHASAVNTLLDINQRFDITGKDRVLAVSALSFDLSVYDFFGILAAGGCIVCVTQEDAKNPSHWLNMVEKHQVTVWDTVPISASLLTEQLEAEQRISSAPLRVVMMSGDWIDPTLPARLWKYFPPCNTYSLGGATEGSVWSIHYPITSDTSHLNSVPYGTPLSGQSFHIFNQALQHCPVGITGELHIGGRGVAREYFAQPKLTAERFIEHPELGRLYKTGDLGRYRDDGVIEFMGRLDKQLKIRGFRIEPGEIESHLKDLPGIEEAVVAAREKAGSTVLVAWYTCSDAEYNATQLAEWLSERVPAYMLPSAYQALECLPITANGKLDQKALPDPDFLVSTSVYTAPSTPTETQLCEIVQALLGTSQVSVSESFFALGGHSLLAIGLITRIKKEFQVEVSTRELFGAAKLSELAMLIEQKVAIKANEALDIPEDCTEVEW